MKNGLIIGLSLIILSCESNVNFNSKEGKEIIIGNQPICPEGHKDSLIPVQYGFPSEEMFTEADSDKVWLGGCELPEVESNWYCKKHHIQF